MPGVEIFALSVIIYLCAAPVCQGEAEVGRDPRGGYVPLNSLTITSLFKNDKPGEEAAPPSTYKPWWSDLQQVGQYRHLKYLTGENLKVVLAKFQLQVENLLL